MSAALVLGGVDLTGPSLYSIYPHGSVDKLPYVTMGSGSLAAMAVFEDRFKPGMELEEGKKLVRDAIAAGVFNDLVCDSFTVVMDHHMLAYGFLSSYHRVRAATLM